MRIIPKLYRKYGKNIDEDFQEFWLEFKGPPRGFGSKEEKAKYWNDFEYCFIGWSSKLPSGEEEAEELNFD